MICSFLFIYAVKMGLGSVTQTPIAIEDMILEINKNKAQTSAFKVRHQGGTYQILFVPLTYNGME